MLNKIAHNLFFTVISFILIIFPLFEKYGRRLIFLNVESANKCTWNKFALIVPRFSLLLFLSIILEYIQLFHFKSSQERILYAKCRLLSRQRCEFSRLSFRVSFCVCAPLRARERPTSDRARFMPHVSEFRVRVRSKLHVCFAVYRLATVASAASVASQEPQTRYETSGEWWRPRGGGS